MEVETSVSETEKIWAS